MTSAFVDEYFIFINKCISEILSAFLENNLVVLVDNLRNFTKISNTRFVPFGRSILIQMLDYVTEEPVSRKDYVYTPMIS